MADEMSYYYQIESEWEVLKEEKAALRAALSALVAAKDEKDAHGDTPRYRELKAGAWDRAREVLAEIP